MQNSCQNKFSASGNLKILHIGGLGLLVLVNKKDKEAQSLLGCSAPRRLQIILAAVKTRNLTKKEKRLFEKCCLDSQVKFCVRIDHRRT